MAQECTMYLYSSDNKARIVLYYLFHHNKETIKNVEVINKIHLVTSSFADDKTDEENNIDREYLYFMLGKGHHELTFKGHLITLDIFLVIENHSIFILRDYTSEIIKEVKVQGPSLEVLYDLISESTKYFTNITKELENNSNVKVKKYIYDAEGYWEYMNASERRCSESLFLKEGEKESILDYALNFFSKDTKEDYIKFNIPYKSNILLYGKPGTGKTSTILAIASHIKTNIGIIPISREITDSKLVHAFNTIKKYDCKILVIEDIDCMFIERKQHDTMKNSITLSGILNCLDGFFRKEGIIVFLTTNVIDSLDEALIRSSRIDYKLEYTDANKYQIYECYKYYFPDKLERFERFYNKVSFKSVSIATLQEFFFKYRKSENIIDHIIEIDKMLKNKEVGNIYS